MCVKTSGPEPRPTFHERRVGPAVVVEVRAVDVPQAVIPQLGRVAQTLQDGVHETLETGKKTVSSIRNGQSVLRVSESEVKSTHGVAQVPQPHQALRTLALFKQKGRRF